MAARERRHGTPPPARAMPRAGLAARARASSPAQPEHCAPDMDIHGCACAGTRRAARERNRRRRGAAPDSLRTAPLRRKPRSARRDRDPRPRSCCGAKCDGPRWNTVAAGGGHGPGRPGSRRDKHPVQRPAGHGQLLDAVHREPAVQARAAPARRRAGHALRRRRRPRRCSTASPACGACNAGHCRPRIVEAIQRQAATMDFAPTFQMGHPLAFEAAERVAAMLPEGLNRVFFTNSGSEAVDTALKIALAYHRVRGEGARTRLIGRERGYHGVGFGGISVGGIAGNRKHFGGLLTGVDHLPHTHDLARNAFSRGQPQHGAELADALERHRRPARREQHRRGDRRAAGGLHRRAGAAARLPAAPARDLHPPRHPADLRRGDQRLRPPRPPLRGRSASAWSPTW